MPWIFMHRLAKEHVQLYMAHIVVQASYNYTIIACHLSRMILSSLMMTVRTFWHALIVIIFVHDDKALFYPYMEPYHVLQP